MEINGTNWNYIMLPFFGQEKALIDSNGRVKLSPRFIQDFRDACRGEVALFCLPEGAVAIYPEETFLRMRQTELAEAEKAANSILQRRRMRFSGAMTHSDKISNQGRITIPHFMREECSLLPGKEIFMIGVEIGIEIWAADKWQQELEKMKQHTNEKGEREMASDLVQDTK